MIPLILRAPGSPSPGSGGKNQPNDDPCEREKEKEVNPDEAIGIRPFLFIARGMMNPRGATSKMAPRSKTAGSGPPLTHLDPGESPVLVTRK